MANVTLDPAMMGQAYDPEVEMMGRRKRPGRRLARRVRKAMARRRAKRRALMARLRRRRRGGRLLKAMPVPGLRAKLLRARLRGEDDLDMEYMGRRRRRRRRKRSLKGLKRKLRKKGLRRKLRARLKKWGLRKKIRKRLKKLGWRKKIRARLKSRRGKRRLKKMGKALALGPFGFLAKRRKARKARKARKRRAALRRRGAAAIVPRVEAPSMVEDADVESDDLIQPGETAVMAPGLRLRKAAGAVAEALTEPEDVEEAEDMDVDTTEAGAGGVMAMVKRNPMLVALPIGGIALFMLMGGKRKGSGGA